MKKSFISLCVLVMSVIITACTSPAASAQPIQPTQPSAVTLKDVPTAPIKLPKTFDGILMVPAYAKVSDALMLVGRSVPGPYAFILREEDDPYLSSIGQGGFIGAIYIGPGGISRPSRELRTALQTVIGKAGVDSWCAADFYRDQQPR